MNRKNLLFVFAALVVIMSSGCRSTFPKPSIVVSLIPAPPATLEVGLSTPLSATVTGDTQNGGVDWTVTCANANCGSFTPAHTASGATTVYTAPTTPTTVTITAASTDSTNGASATAMITIGAVAAASSLSGQYAFNLSGFDSTGALYVAAGSVTLDGMGNVTAGEEDLNDSSQVATFFDNTLTGTYTVGPDGRGSMTLTVTGGTQTLSFAVVNNNHALIEEFDASLTSAGSLDLQTTTAASALTGGYAFYIGGSVGGVPYVEAGVTSADGAGNFTSTGTVDYDNGGTVTTGQSLTGSLAGPTIDASGRGVLTFGSNTFAIYVIGPEVFRIIDTDTTSFTAAGSAYGQGSGAGGFSAASLTGPFVFNVKGISVAGDNEQVGLVTTDGVSGVAGVIDYNQMGVTPPAPPAPDTITAGSYTVATNGYGSATLPVTGNANILTFGVYVTDPTLNLSDPNNTTGGTGSALFVELDPASTGHGILAPQTSTAAAAGNNSINLDGDLAVGPADAVGQVVSDGSASFSGSVDANELGSGQLSGVPLTGAFTADATNAGRYTGTLNLNSAVVPYGFVFYQANSGLALHILEDPLNVASGVIETQQ